MILSDPDSNFGYCVLCNISHNEPVLARMQILVNRQSYVGYNFNFVTELNVTGSQVR